MYCLCFVLFSSVLLPCLYICSCSCSCCVCAAGCVNSSLSQGSANAAVLDVTQTGGHKKRVRRSSFLNAKKLYEDAQMARKVKQYLSKLSLETNEDSLQTLSLQCEPSISTREFATEMVKSETFRFHLDIVLITNGGIAGVIPKINFISF